jgi:hypothetical protein
VVGERVVLAVVLAVVLEVDFGVVKGNGRLQLQPAQAAPAAGRAIPTDDPCRPQVRRLRKMPTSPIRKQSEPLTMYQIV